MQLKRNYRVTRIVVIAQGVLLKVIYHVDVNKSAIYVL